jgi:hypothetical protein
MHDGNAILGDEITRAEMRQCVGTKTVQGCEGSYDVKTWDDNDPTTWRGNIDHIKPQSDFVFTSFEDIEVIKCWGLDNLRPLSAKQNVIEGANRTRHNKNIMNEGG